MAEAGVLGEQLGHHRLRVGALGEDVAVAAVAGREVVVGVHRGADAGRDRLLAERGVDEAGDLRVAVEGGDLRLEGADQRQGREALDRRRQMVSSSLHRVRYTRRSVRRSD